MGKAWVWHWFEYEHGRRHSLFDYTRKARNVRYSKTCSTCFNGGCKALSLKINENDRVYSTFATMALRNWDLFCGFDRKYSTCRWDFTKEIALHCRQMDQMHKINWFCCSSMFFCPKTTCMPAIQQSYAGVEMAELAQSFSNETLNFKSLYLPEYFMQTHAL